MRRMADRSVWIAAYRLAALLGGLLFLVGTWFLLFHLSSTWTKGFLNPWDVSMERPPVGSWEEAANAFFCVSPGKNIPSALLLSISAGLYLWRAWRSDDRATLAFGLALTNLFACMLSYLAFWVALIGGAVVSHFFLSSGIGFHNSVLPSAVMTAFFAGYLLIQARAPFERWLSASPEVVRDDGGYETDSVGTGL